MQDQPQLPLEPRPDEAPPRPAEARGQDGSRPRRALVVLLGVSIALLGCVVWPFRAPLFIAAVLAAAFQPALRWSTRLLGGRRRTAGGLLTVVVFAAIIAPFATLLGLATQQVMAGLAFLRDTLGVRRVSDLSLAQLPGPAQDVLAHALALAHVSREQLAGWMDQARVWGEHAAPSLLAASGEAAFHTLILLGAFYFLVLDGHVVVRWLSDVSPLRRGQTRELIEEFRKVAVATLLGTVVAAVFQGVAAGLGYAIFGVPQAFFFGLLTALASFVPVVGTLAVWVPAVVLLSVTGHLGAGLGLAAWCLVAVVGAEHVGRPLLLGGSAEMHTGLVFLALLGGIEMFGLIGVLAGPLVIAFFLALARMSARELAGAGPPRAVQAH
ncbi:AI-2E family transporter [Anaeromyxobacter diazotrophicus]|uniref:AI-2E family transporter n=1 Tax=Anaeromyxobacter diazotrophicus TaxID=2590199 RepID=A0A7I9VLB9_9BACT|nr:AI-2E family transporter [Anaeromyxobacter diazotrophicus]GEJ56920.1 AI-2E family transporter [Anaeromyxobacter diazotrophicus]